MTAIMAESVTDPAIELTGLTKLFGAAAAVGNLSLAVPPGTTLGLIGPNGAGKSTTIKLLMGLLRPTVGEARVLGLDPLSEPVRVKQRVGYVPETHNIYRWMRVGQVIGLCRALYWRWNDKICQRMLDLFKLDPNKKVKHLSKGMLVKLSLLLAVSHEPEVLLLDEPMAGLDPLAREEFLDGVLRTVCDGRQTVLFSSHTLDDVERIAEDVAILYEGRLLTHGSIDQLVSTTKRIRAVLADGAQPERLPAGTIWQRREGREWLLTVRDFAPEKAAEVRGCPGVEHVEVLDLRLEDVFKDFVKGQREAK
jgi:ABC-2 type transport system ATP-binding protein